MIIPLLLGIAIYCDSPGRPYYAPFDGVHLPPGECQVLAGRRVDWVAAYATFNLAHELGHAMTGCTANTPECEARADCYAAGNVGRVARLTGRTARQARFIVRLAREGRGFGYQPIPRACWVAADA